MSKIIRKKDITNLVESTMKQAGYILESSDSELDEVRAHVTTPKSEINREEKKKADKKYFDDKESGKNPKKPDYKKLDEDLGDYYGGFSGGNDWYDKEDYLYDMTDDDDWDEVEYESYEDFANSPYRQDPNNKWSIHPNYREGETMFNDYMGANGPFRVRSRRINDVVQESVNKLAKEASKKNIISENLKKELASFNKIINYKY